MPEYFFDSYAIIELLRGNPQYLPYGEKAVTITFLNLMEVVHSVVMEFGEKKGKEIYEKFQGDVQGVDWPIILQMTQLKQKLHRRNVSYADCLGYAFAQQKGMLFLTGDKEFKGLPGVEFVEK